MPDEQISRVKPVVEPAPVVELTEPVTEKLNGKLVRRVKVVAADGTTYEQIREVVETLEEARAKCLDYYHPEFGWIRYGYKLERDRDVNNILADNSQSQLKQLT